MRRLSGRTELAEIKTGNRVNLVGDTAACRHGCQTSRVPRAVALSL